MTNLHRGATREIKPGKEAKRRCMRCGDIKPSIMYHNKSMICKDCKEVLKQNFLKGQERRNQ